jgi:hypothetical protein
VAAPSSLSMTARCTRRTREREDKWEGEKKKQRDRYYSGRYRLDGLKTN